MKVKFCGITNLEDAKNAIARGAGYLGFIVDFPKSPRSVSIGKFLKLAEEIKTLKSVSKNFPKIVAVTVNMEESKLLKLASSGLVDVLQFHGDEAPEFCSRFKKNIEVWKSFKIKGEENEKDKKTELEKYLGKIDKFLLDASSAEDKAGGKKIKFENYKIFTRLRKLGWPLILAGGISPLNIDSYINKLKPEIIDVSQGVEDYPGKKSNDKMKLLMKNIIAE
ncbi:MAG: phosphoribosylanthranilate isomerase [Patescibacteria group bacterium]|jgi:phosphoribosylanthranilate isomerase